MCVFVCVCLCVCVCVCVCKREGGREDPSTVYGCVHAYDLTQNAWSWYSKVFLFEVCMLYGLRARVRVTGLGCACVYVCEFN